MQCVIYKLKKAFVLYVTFLFVYSVMYVSYFVVVITLQSCQVKQGFRFSVNPVEMSGILRQVFGWYSIVHSDEHIR